MDIVAAKVALNHSRNGVATVSFDEVELSPILSGDLVKVEGKLVATGSSSMVVEVTAYKKDMLSRCFEMVQHSFVTMVAIDRQHRPWRNVPPLVTETEEEKRKLKEFEKRKERSLLWEKQEKRIREMKNLTVEEVEHPFNKQKQEFVTIKGKLLSFLSSETLSFNQFTTKKTLRLLLRSSSSQKT